MSTFLRGWSVESAHACDTKYEQLSAAHVHTYRRSASARSKSATSASTTAATASSSVSASSRRPRTLR